MKLLLKNMKQLLKKIETPDRQDKCWANGCPMRATIQIEGSRWLCFCHAFSESDVWPMVTERINENQWLYEFIGDIHSMHAKHKNWRGFAAEFWNDQDDYCKPHQVEDAGAYTYRMRGELAWRAGTVPKRPRVRIPKHLKHLYA